LALLEEVVVDLTAQLADFFFEVGAILSLELDVALGLFAVSGSVDLS